MNHLQRFQVTNFLQTVGKIWWKIVLEMFTRSSILKC